MRHVQSWSYFCGTNIFDINHLTNFFFDAASFVACNDNICKTGKLLLHNLINHQKMTTLVDSKVAIISRDLVSMGAVGVAAPTDFFRCWLLILHQQILRNVHFELFNFHILFSVFGVYMTVCTNSFEILSRPLTIIISKSILYRCYKQ